MQCLMSFAQFHFSGTRCLHKRLVCTAVFLYFAHIINLNLNNNLFVFHNKYVCINVVALC